MAVITTLISRGRVIVVVMMVGKDHRVHPLGHIPSCHLWVNGKVAAVQEGFGHWRPTLAILVNVAKAGVAVLDLRADQKAVGRRR